MAFVNEPENNRTIDYEKNIILFCEDYDRDNYYKFKILIDQEPVEIYAQHKLFKSRDGEYLLHWDIINIRSSEGIDLNDKEIISLIEEAIKSFGYHHNNRDGKIEFQYLEM